MRFLYWPGYVFGYLCNGSRMGSPDDFRNRNIKRKTDHHLFRIHYFIIFDWYKCEPRAVFHSIAVFGFHLDFDFLSIPVYKIDVSMLEGFPGTARPAGSTRGMLRDFRHHYESVLVFQQFDPVDFSIKGAKFREDWNALFHSPMTGRQTALRFVQLPISTFGEVFLQKQCVFNYSGSCCNWVSEWIIKPSVFFRILNAHAVSP